MRLVTHNQLICIRGQCETNYPLRLQVHKLEQDDTDVNVLFLAHVMTRVDYKVLYDAAVQLGVAEGLPAPGQLPDLVAIAKRIRAHQKRQEVGALQLAGAHADEEEDDEDDEDDDNEDDDNSMQTESTSSSSSSSAPSSSSSSSSSAAPRTLSLTDSAELMTALHRVLFDVHVQEGALVCPGCSRAYLVQEGIPNMRLNEDEL